MYIPDIYVNENRSEILRFIEENSFAILVNQSNSKINATNIPLFIEKSNDNQLILSGHISKLNPQSENFAENGTVLAIFSGAHSYISSSWYDYEEVPTWNYLAVHVEGKIEILNEEQKLIHLENLVNKYEKNSENPISTKTLSEKTMLQANGILAFNIIVSNIDAVKKLSQNKSENNKKSIISHLEKLGDEGSKSIAKEMKNM
ncbi:FMN-binding negative transcriptional regulator [Flavobacterium sp. F372]|uniref:FMN-binding negative transcriptional regulator n=1 Tax=Flavobacterium bernardetii TaxID=2813823 RepID=A0ABR7IXW1_9FLAO|nr:FMN-binding negative transcriptional regulator [Flavobacterium bernardetii]MBC5834613.1 FMN-binding negative transcriptional regulator [Flavobacterium bernardetii]NHF70261.1 FMN-binding negative transcriptional regulator [Flavobacterium bernardetii]